MPQRTDIPETSTPHGFARSITVSKIGEAGLKLNISANPGELPKIAAYLGLESLQSFAAEIDLARWRGKGIVLTGHFIADVTQACVVTLDPVESHLEGDFERRFLPNVQHPDAQEIEIDPDGEDPAEELGRDIDIGEILLEELSLALDPYPRKPGVEFEPEQDKVPKEDKPFAVLAKLQAKASKAKPKT